MTPVFLLAESEWKRNVIHINVLRGTFFIFHYRKTVISSFEKAGFLHGVRRTITGNLCDGRRMPLSGNENMRPQNIQRAGISLAQQPRRSEQVRSEMKGIRTGCLKDGFTNGGHGMETGAFHIQNTSVLQFDHQSGFCFIIWSASYAFN